MKKFKSEKSRKRKERKYVNGLRQSIDSAIKYGTGQTSLKSGGFKTVLTIQYPKNLSKANFPSSSSVFERA